MKFGFSLTNGPQNNLLEVCSYLLNELKVKYTKSNLRNLLEDHLDPSSLLAVKDTLSEYGIESGAIKKGSHSYLDFELPFICSIQQNDRPSPAFTVVTNVNEDTIEYLHPLTKELTTTTLKIFQSIDKEIIMLLDSSKHLDESHFEQNLVNERNNSFLANLPFVITLIGLFICVGYTL